MKVGCAQGAIVCSAGEEKPRAWGWEEPGYESRRRDFCGRQTYAAETGWTAWIPPVFAGHVPTPDPELLKSFSLQNLGVLFHLHMKKKSEVLAQDCGQSGVTIRP